MTTFHSTNMYPSYPYPNTMGNDGVTPYNPHQNNIYQNPYMMGQDEVIPYNPDLDNMNQNTLYPQPSAYDSSINYNGIQSNPTYDDLFIFPESNQTDSPSYGVNSQQNPQYVQPQENYTHPQQFNPLPFIPKNTVQRSIHQETVELLQKAYDLTNPYLKRKNPNPLFNPNRDTSSSSIFNPIPSSVRYQTTSIPSMNFDFSDKSIKLLNNETHVNHTTGNNDKQSQKEKNDNRRFLVGLIGFIGACAAVFFIGKAIAKSEEIHDDKFHYQELKARWITNQTLYDDGYRMDVDSVVKNMDQLLLSKQKKRTQKIALLAFYLLAGSLGVASAIVASKALMATAVALGAITVVASLFKLGYDLFSTREKKLAASIDTNLNNLKQKTVTIVG